MHIFKLFGIILCLVEVQSNALNLNYEEILKELEAPIYTPEMETFLNNITYEEMLKELQARFKDPGVNFLEFKSGSKNSESESKKTIIPSNWHKIDFTKDRIAILNETGFAIHLIDIDKKRFIKFVVDCPSKSCTILIQGSKIFDCQTSIVCDQPLDFGENSDCKQNYLLVFDGYQGFNRFCNGFDFKRQSYKARQQGRGLIVRVAGQSKNTVCMAFCREDLFNSEEENHGILYPTVLNKIPGALGYKEDSSCVCGVRKSLESRIVRGKDAKKNEFPWIAGIVSLHKNYSFTNGSPICGATLISDLHLISAAHCFLSTVDPKDYTILLHAHVVNKHSSGYTEEEAISNPGWNLTTDNDSFTVDIAKISIFPGYYIYNFYKSDIAIITLKERLDFEKQDVFPICLQRITEILNIKPDTKLTIAGWGNYKPRHFIEKTKQRGNTRILQTGDIPFIDQQICNEHFFKGLFEISNHTNICAGNISAEEQVNTCQGDSGGPLIMKTNEGKNQYTLVGIVSWALGCAQTGWPTYFTDVQEYLSWIYGETLWGNDATWCAR